MRVRKANILDLQWCVSEGIKFLKFYFPNKEVDEGFIHTQLHALISNGVMIVTENEEEVTGMICGIISPNMWYPQEKELTELFWWVAERYRSGRSSLMLLKEFIKTGRDAEVTRIVMSLLSVSPVNDNALVKRGFNLKEKAFVMEV